MSGGEGAADDEGDARGDAARTRGWMDEDGAGQDTAEIGSGEECGDSGGVEAIGLADVGAIGLDVGADAKPMAPTERGSWRGELRKRMAWKGETGQGCEHRIGTDPSGEKS